MTVENEVERKQIHEELVLSARVSETIGVNSRSQTVITSSLWMKKLKLAKEK